MEDILISNSFVLEYASIATQMFFIGKVFFFNFTFFLGFF